VRRVFERPRKSALLTVAVGLFGATRAMGEPVCEPVLAVTDVRFSASVQPASGRLWFATVAVDASRCAGDSTGAFEVVITRSKENAPDVEFRERFVWRAPSVKIGVDLWADEAVARYRIDGVTPCHCPG
jgi:hypothetical protein